MRDGPLPGPPAALALDDGARAWTRSELDREAEAAAERLREEGVAEAEAIAMSLPPSAEAVVWIHGVLRAGAVLLPLHHGWTAAERRRAVEAVGVGIVLEPGEGATGGGASHLSESVRITRVATPRTPAPLPPGTDVVLWTSGTSGRPRGVALSLAGLRAVSEGSRERLAPGPDERWYGVLSPAHVGGLSLVLRCAWTEAAVVPRERFDPEGFLSLAREGRASHASLVPVMLRGLLDAAGDADPPAALRCLLVGGAHAPPALVRAATERGWPVALTYGLTEASSQVCTAAPEEVREDPESVGRPLPDVELSIALPVEGEAGAPDRGPQGDRASDGPARDRARDGTGGRGREGEILVRGPTVALGYVGADDDLPVEDGWLHTGDVGRLRPDGRLRVTGRRFERIVTGGVNVDPGEVEGVLRSHPEIRDALVVGLPDPEWGERVGALVVREPGPAPDRDALVAWLRSRLASPKLPRTLVFPDELPLLPNGKPDRSAAREMLRSEGVGSARPHPPGGGAGSPAP